MIARWLARLPSFGAQVIWLLTSIGGLAVALVAIGVVVVAYVDLRNEALSSIESRTRIVAMNSAAPLAFGDRSAGYEALDALHGSPYVARATVFDPSGKRFAQYAREERPAPALQLDDQLGFATRRGWQVFTAPVEEAGRPMGFVQVVFDLDRLYYRVATLLTVVLAIAGAAIALIHGLARGLGGALVRPIEDLSRAARDISQTRDYSLRAPPGGRGELGQLATDFNGMLDELQKQHGELQAARRDAEQASRSKDEFLATLSHELRTPMTPILGWSQILLRVAEDPAKVRQGAEIIERNARIQTRLIDDLLDMSRIIAGKMVLRVEDVALAPVVDQALATVQAAAEARGVTLAFERGGPLPPVRGDAGRLQQIAWNLLSNAIKFTPKGGHVRVTLSRPGEDVLRLAVQDDGQGMAAELLPHVFERFRQADSSTTRAHGGLGLGLAIVKQLVEQHGGSIRAESPGPGRGATFTVDFPVPQGRAAPMPPERPETAVSASVEAAALGEVRVLLVDDEADARHLMQHVLAEAGALVSTADSAGQALATLRVAPPDVLVSDIGMPDMDGYGLIRAVRSLPPPQGGRVPAIALTAFAREEDRQRALQAGFQRHLGKPVAPEDLVACVAALHRAARSGLSPDA